MKAAVSRVRRVNVAASQKALVACLQGLDQLLGLAVDGQARRLGPGTLLDPWRGMHLDATEVKALLASQTRKSLASDGAAELLAALGRKWPSLAGLARRLRLNAIDIAALIIVLAPDLDLRYERLYGYLQDDVARKRPSIDLVANLLAASPQERLTVLSRFEPQAPLRRHAIVRLHGSAEIPELARPLVVDPLWRHQLLGRDAGSAPLGGLGCLADAAPQGLETLAGRPVLQQIAERAVQTAAQDGAPLRLLLQGPHGAGKFELARAMAGALGQQLLVIDLRDLASPTDLAPHWQRIRQGAAAVGALPFVLGVDALAAREGRWARAVIDALAGDSGGFIVASVATLPSVHSAPLRALRMVLELPSAEQRLQAWRDAVAAQSIDADAEHLVDVAERFRLSRAQIAQAAVDLAVGTRMRGDARADMAALAAAARALCGEDLARLAQRIRPQAGRDALVVTIETAAQLGEICQRVAVAQRVRRDWTRDSVHARHDGVTALFAGPSGTGKTLAAEVIAHELGLDLFCIDLSAVVSKYIGETEKNLDRVFAAAENANAVLFFDEADALFGKRSEVKDAHDRYANIEISYLLQKMERFDGLAILATNLRQNLDEAFTRRLAFCVGFPFPEHAERLRLWHALWPPQAPRGDDVDLDALAGEYRISGGQIRNIVIAALHLAASDGGVVMHAHLLHALRREYQKLGKQLALPVRQALVAAA